MAQDWLPLVPLPGFGDCPTKNQHDPELRGPLEAEVTTEYGADTDHTFTATATDWGFSNFMPLAELNKAGSGFMDDNQDFQVRILVKVIPADRHPNRLAAGAMRSPALLRMAYARSLRIDKEGPSGVGPGVAVSGRGPVWGCMASRGMTCRMSQQACTML